MKKLPKPIVKYNAVNEHLISIWLSGMSINTVKGFNKLFYYLRGGSAAGPLLANAVTLNIAIGL